MKKTIFLTGASGSMGSEAFKELLKRRERFNIVLLLLPGAKEKRAFHKYKNNEGIKIIWGDITNYENVLQGVTGADYILNTAAIIPPLADRYPELAAKVNYDGVKNILQAIQAQPNGCQQIKFVNVASVAMTGDRLPPIHLGRVGDPLKPNLFDHYALSKISAEREVIESGLKYWVSLRMTYIAIPNVLSLLNPIMFHQPLATCCELITKRDAGFMIVNTCEDHIPETFWRRVYNASGGPNTRFIYHDYLQQVMKLLCLGEFKKLMEDKWFCRRNFHCHFFEDAHLLNNYLHHWRDTLQDHYQQILEESPLILKLYRSSPLRYLIQPWVIKNLLIKPKAYAKDGPMGWIRNKERERLLAFFGSDQNQTFSLVKEEKKVGKPFHLNHGYNENKPEKDLNINDLQTAAKFRGGYCRAVKMKPGDLRTKLEWQCAFGHIFKASPYLVLKTGHWCPVCDLSPWNHSEIATKNPFFAQVWNRY